MQPEHCPQLPPGGLVAPVALDLQGAPRGAGRSSVSVPPAVPPLAGWQLGPPSVRRIPAPGGPCRGARSAAGTGREVRGRRSGTRGHRWQRGGRGFEVGRGGAVGSPVALRLSQLSEDSSRPGLLGASSRILCIFRTGQEVVPAKESSGRRDCL